MTAGGSDIGNTSLPRCGPRRREHDAALVDQIIEPMRSRDQRLDVRGALIPAGRFQQPVTNDDIDLILDGSKLGLIVGFQAPDVERVRPLSFFRRPREPCQGRTGRAILRWAGAIRKRR